jgi:phytoene/squalene synthetase
MARGVQQHGFTRRWFDRMIDEREADAVNKPAMETIADIERFAQHTACPLLYLALECAGVDSAEADETASLVGQAGALAGTLRSVPALAPFKRTYLPTDLLFAQRLTERELFKQAGGSDSVSPAAPETDAKLRVVVEAVVEAAEANLRAARQAHSAGGVPSAALPALAPALPSALYLKRVRAAGFNLLDPSLNVSRLCIWRSATRHSR